MKNELSPELKIKAPGPEAQKILILGQSGYGKTTWMKKHLPKFKRVIVIDTLNIFGDIVKDGFHVSAPEDIPHWFARDDGQKEIRLIVNCGDPRRVFELSEIAARGILHEKVRNVYVAIDEVDLLIPKMKWRHPVVKLVRFARNKGIGVIASARQTQEVNVAMLANADIFVCFRVQDEGTLYKMKKLGIQNAGILSSIDRKGEYYIRRPDKPSLLLGPYWFDPKEFYHRQKESLIEL